MSDKFWRLYNHLSRQWYELEYGKVPHDQRFYQRQMDLMSDYMVQEAAAILGRE